MNETEIVKGKKEMVNGVVGIKNVKWERKRGEGSGGLTRGKTNRSGSPTWKGLRGGSLVGRGQTRGSHPEIHVVQLDAS